MLLTKEEDDDPNGDGDLSCSIISFLKTKTSSFIVPSFLA
jgi:hypothetical protein